MIFNIVTHTLSSPWACAEGNPLTEEPRQHAEAGNAKPSKRIRFSRTSSSSSSSSSSSQIFHCGCGGNNPQARASGAPRRRLCHQCRRSLPDSSMERAQKCHDCPKYAHQPPHFLLLTSSSSSSSDKWCILMAPRAYKYSTPPNY
jgi:hypothetical protein